MTINEARKVLGKDGNDLTDEQVQEYINSASILAEIAIDTFKEMTPEERKKFIKHEVNR